jgi:glutathione S-transferase
MPTVSESVGPRKLNADPKAVRGPVARPAKRAGGLAVLSDPARLAGSPRRTGSTGGGPCRVAPWLIICAAVSLSTGPETTRVPGLAAAGAAMANAMAAAQTPVRWLAAMRVTVHRIPFSTNVERIALAAAHKGIAVEWVDHDPADRSTIRALSGQDFVPVAEIDGRVIADSPVILRELERLVPEPALWPAGPARRAEADVFVDWFNRVWKVAPNRMAGAADAAELRGSLDRFEALLDGREHLLGDEFGIADVIAFPFLKYAAGIAPDDPDAFHHVLAEHLALGDDFPRLRDWIARCDRRPRA